MFLINEYGQKTSRVGKRTVNYHCGKYGRACGICAGGQYICGGRGKSVASGRNAYGKKRAGDRGIRGKSRRYKRRFSGAGFCGNGSAVLEPVRQRNGGRSDPGLYQRAFYPRRFRIHCLSGIRCD